MNEEEVIEQAKASGLYYDLINEGVEEEEVLELLYDYLL